MKRAFVKAFNKEQRRQATNVRKGRKALAMIEDCGLQKGSIVYCVLHRALTLYSEGQDESLNAAIDEYELATGVHFSSEKRKRVANKYKYLLEQAFQSLKDEQENKTPGPP